MQAWLRGASQIEDGPWASKFTRPADNAGAWLRGASAGRGASSSDDVAQPEESVMFAGVMWLSGDSAGRGASAGRGFLQRCVASVVRLRIDRHLTFVQRGWPF